MLRATNRPLLAYFDAIKNLRLRQVALILKAGYDPNLMVNARGQNGLQYLINYYGATDAHFRLQVPINMSGYLGIAKLLLDSGLDPNVTDLLTDETVIFDAIRFNDKEMVSLLLNYADLSLRNKNGETPLMCAARFGSKQVMRLLLEHLRQLEMDGYFLRQRNRFGLTALELARAENIECAKVLTKHLIAFGQHTNAVLARSSSHHQLMSRSYPYHMRAAYTPRGPAALLDVDSGSDYESDILVPSPYNRMAGRSYGPGGVPKARVAPLYDPKAAEFNQYLLEQREMAGGSGQQSGAGAARANPGAISDDEDYLGTGADVVSSSGGLTRSRSCMLGPGMAGSKQQKYGGPTSGQAKKCGESSKIMGASWDSNTGAGRDSMG